MSGVSIAPYFAFARTKVVSQAVHPDSGGALIHLEPDLRFRPVCHACRTPARTVHTTGYRRTIRDLSVTDRHVFLQVQYRKVWCDRCGKAKVEHLSFCHAARRLTDRFRRYVYDLCKLLPVAQVARHLELDPKTVN